MSRVIQGMKVGDVDSVLQVIKAYMSGVPYDAEEQNELHYKTIVYCVFSLATPYLTRCEEKSAAGRCDVVVETADAVYMFEFLFKPSEAPNVFGHFRGDKNALDQNGQVQFKLDGNGTAEQAIKQIEGKGYLIPYTASFAADGSPKKLFKIGVCIDTKKRTLGDWKIVEGS